MTIEHDSFLRRRFGQFSLLQLLLAVGIVCLAAAYVGLSVELGRIQEQIKQKKVEVERRQEHTDKLRASFGLPPLMDLDKVHLIEEMDFPLPRPDGFSWQWRIFVPPEKRWRLKAAIGKIPMRGFKVVPEFDVEIDGFGLQTLEVLISLPEHKQRELIVKWADYKMSCPLTEDQVSQLLSVAERGGCSTLSRNTKIRDSQRYEPLQLLRFHSNYSGTKSAEGILPGLGLLIWLEEVKTTSEKPD